MTILNITFGQKDLYSAKYFLPIAAGGGRYDIQCDDEGDNISSRNNTFGELTSVYWAWKNLKDVDIIGMSHYRRYLMPEKGIFRYIPYTKTFYNITWRNFCSSNYSPESFCKYLSSKRYDFIFAKRWHFEGLSIERQFLQHHPFPEDLTMTRSILMKHHPEAVDCWDDFMKGSDAYCCCLFICNWSHFDHLCNWMFPMLFEIEGIIDIKKYDKYQQRIIAFLYERLLNVYLVTHEMKIKEVPFYMVGEGNYKSILRQDIGAKIWTFVQKIRFR